MVSLVEKEAFKIMQPRIYWEAVFIGEIWNIVKKRAIAKTYRSNIAQKYYNIQKRYIRLLIGEKLAKILK